MMASRGANCRSYTLLAALICGAVAAAPVGLTAAESGPAAKTAAGESVPNSLDNALLKDLGIPERPAGAAPAAAKPADPPADSEATSEMLIRPLGAGQDLGQPSGAVLVAIGRRMRLAELLISRQVTSKETQGVQQQVIRDLERLIDEMQRQSADGQGGTKSPVKPGSKPDGTGRAGSGEDAGSDQPARESTDRIEGEASDREQLARLEIMLKQIWGHLPPKIRDQMQSAAIEEFLPKYERLIEQYYSRLAEDARR